MIMSRMRSSSPCATIFPQPSNAHGPLPDAGFGKVGLSKRNRLTPRRADDALKNSRFAFGNADTGTFRAQPTSLVDVMAIILIFLIKTFLTEGIILTPSSDLDNSRFLCPRSETGNSRSDEGVMIFPLFKRS